MPLSEHEQRLLEQMERALYAEDPKFASALQNTTVRRANRKRLILGVLVVVLGLGLLIAGVAAKLAVVGVVGFLGMLLGAVIALTGGSSSKEVDATDSPKGPTKSTSSAKNEGGGFMGRLEDRWRQRREGEQQQ